MYHAVVKQKTKQIYASLSAGDYEDVLRSFSPDARFSFLGDHALGGRLESRELIGAWFARLFRLLPDLRLTPEVIVVDGFPWDTRVATRFSVAATLPDGRPYSNHGMQFVRLRWGRVVEDLIYEDTQALSAALEAIAESGTSEALADPVAQSP